MLDESSDNESNASIQKLTINEHYAEAYAYKKERQEYLQLQEKYGSDAELEPDEDDSEDETEDEDGEELTPAVDAAILRTLARIRRGDPDIYDSSKSVFQTEAEKTSASVPWGHRPRKEKEAKPITIKDQNRSALLNPDARSQSPSPAAIPSHFEEQRALRDETISAFHQAVSGEDGADDDMGGGLLTLREKTKDELVREEEEYQAYLEREVGNVKDLVWIEPTPGADEAAKDSSSEAEKEPNAQELSEKKKKKKKKKGKEPAKPETDQEFLMNYILNRGWIDRESRHLPTYSEITSTHAPIQPTKSAPGGDADREGAEPDLDELEEFEDVADVFENSYNFRFEEPDAAVIARHPRNITSTVRREDTTRKDARERRKERKAEEIARRTEEVKRLKALKMREIRKRLDLVGKEGGIQGTEDLEGLDLEGDWDPTKHDEQMATLYGQDDAEPLEDEDGKPVWDDDIDLGDLEMIPDERPKSKKQKKKEERRKAKIAAAAAENGEVVVDEGEMDAEMEGVSYLNDDEEWDGTEEMRKRKLNEYMDQVYGLDFNDVIGGDIATRFKYAPVEKASYSLTPAEILMATDAELNQYMGVKKYAPYRKGKERWDASKVDRLKEFKQKVSSRASPWTNGDGTKNGADGGVAEKKKKRKGKKEREREKGAVATASGPAATAETGEKRTAGEEEGDAPKKKKRRKNAPTEDA